MIKSRALYIPGGKEDCFLLKIMTMMSFFGAKVGQVCHQLLRRLRSLKLWDS
jgi:hypothetical protein